MGEGPSPSEMISVLLQDQEMNCTKIGGSSWASASVPSTITIASSFSELPSANKDRLCTLLCAQIFVRPFRETRSVSQCMSLAQALTKIIIFFSVMLFLE